MDHTVGWLLKRLAATFAALEAANAGAIIVVLVILALGSGPNATAPEWMVAWIMWGLMLPAMLGFGVALVYGVRCLIRYWGES